MEKLREKDIKKATKKAASKPRYTNDEKKTSFKFWLILVSVVLLTIFLAVTALGFYVTNTDTIYKGVVVDGINVGGMTIEEAAMELAQYGFDDEEAVVTISLPMDMEIVISASEVGAEISAYEAAITAYSYGHEGNMYDNIIKYIKSAFTNTTVDLVFDIDETAVREVVEPIIDELILSMVSTDIDMSDETLQIVKGAKTVTIDKEEVISLIILSLSERNYGEQIYEIEVEEGAELDVYELFESVYVDTVDAYYDTETHEIVESVTGISFSITEAEKAWSMADYGDTITINLIIEEPFVTTEEIEAMLYADVLSTATTSLTSSSDNRINNVKLAAEKVNGVILQPGESFDFNTVVGERTEANGFMYAGAYSGGEVVSEVGGGICQVSSTLYYCALLANLQINTRSCHYFAVSYLPPGLDATVSWGGPEFKFTNNRDYPIEIKAWVDTDTKQLTVEFIGTDVDGSYVIMTYASWEIFTDEDYPEVATGYKAATYRNIYDADGNLLSDNIEAYSTYNYYEENIQYPEDEVEVEEPESTVSPDDTETETEDEEVDTGATEEETEEETDEEVWTSPTDLD